MAQQTPKEKAVELIDKFNQHTIISSINYPSGKTKEDLTDAKQCALIAVDEILDTIRIHLMEDQSTEEVVKFVERRLIYWQEVKQEIEKL